MTTCRQQAERNAVTILPDPNEPGHVAEVPDFPAVCAGGDTPAEALECAYEGIASILGVLIEDGTPIPEPSVAAPTAADIRTGSPTTVAAGVWPRRHQGAAGLGRSLLIR